MLSLISVFASFRDFFLFRKKTSKALLREVRGVLSSWEASEMKRFCSSIISFMGFRVLSANKYPSTPERKNIEPFTIIRVIRMRSFASFISSELGSIWSVKRRKESNLSILYLWAFSNLSISIDKNLYITRLNVILMAIIIARYQSVSL